MEKLGIELPSADYHIEKRNRFRDAAAFLATSNRVFSYDPSVQDCFYSAVHEAERFLAQLGRHSRGHGQRENYITNYMVQARGSIRSRAEFSRNPQHPSDRLFDRRSEFYYMELTKLRLDLVYGREILGPLRHASRRDRSRANHILTQFLTVLAGHERILRRRGMI